MYSTKNNVDFISIETQRGRARETEGCRDLRRRRRQEDWPRGVEGPAAVGGGRWHGREVEATGLQVDCVRVLELEGPEFKSQPRFPFLSPDLPAKRG